MKKSLSVFAMGAAAVCLALAPAVFAQSSSSPSQSTKSSSKTRASSTTDQNANRLAAADNSFVTKAAEGGVAEVQLGKLAQSNAENADVKSFGERMVTDHGKANDDLKSVADKKGITLPTSMNSKDQAMYDKLSKLHGAEFDRDYMRAMVSDHRTDVSEFRRESERGSDPDIKSFAARTLPTLEEHLKMAESTDAKVKGGKSK